MASPLNNYKNKKIRLLLKGFIYWLIYAISRSRIATKVYVKLLSIILRPIPFFARVKQVIIDSVFWVEWPDVELSPKTAKIGSKTVIKLIPHFYGYAFEAVVKTDIPYEKEVFSYLESRKCDYDAFIDIGAGIGIYSLFFSSTSLLNSRKKSCDIFAFEPSQEAYFRLIRNLEVNKLNNVSAFNCGIGENTGFFTFYEPKDRLTNGSFNREFAELFSKYIKEKKVLVIKGDFLENLMNNYNKILIKIDTEGYEFFILRSIENLIISKKPELIIEVLPQFEDKLNSLEFLFLTGYRFYNITPDGLVKYEKFKAKEFMNYVLLA